LKRRCTHLKSSFSPSLVQRTFTGSDGIVTRIPNIHIINQRVQNLSRTTSSTVKQVLWFRYEDIDKLPVVLESILEEIRASCPKLIDDGSRTFQAVWTDYKHDHLEVEVEASFLIPPTVDEYDTNKQDMLMAIARAVHKNDVQFAIPTSLCLSKEVSA
jgi:small-conductance mechanosensitive channel